MIDALVLSGTNPAFLILRDLITKGKITGEQAANVVAFLPGTIETPTKELLSAFFVSFHSLKILLKCFVMKTASIKFYKIIIL